MVSTPPATLLTLHRPEIQQLLEHIFTQLTNHTLDTLTQSTHLPAQTDEEILDALQFFLDIITLYFSRTIPHTDTPRTITLHDLQLELAVYIWTMQCEWQDRYAVRAAEEEEDAVLCSVLWDKNEPEHVKLVAGGDKVPLPKHVARVWREGLERVIGGVVWRCDEVRRYEEDIIKRKKGKEAGKQEEEDGIGEVGWLIMVMTGFIWFTC